MNFDNLKFNLYEILNISPDASENKIKKAYKNLILNFHPDKNSEAEEDIYLHIIQANSILTNKEHRKNYDDYLNKKVEDHFDLKNTFKKNLNNTPIVNKEDAQKTFDEKINELNNKHNLSSFSENNIKKNYDKIVREREQQFDIPKEDISDRNEFNSKFENKKSEIIQINTQSDLTINNNYTSLDVAFDNLYIDGGGIATDKYTSLDTAFKVNNINTNIEGKSTDIDSAMKRYKDETELYNKPDFKYTNDKFETW
jgi:curved DNA-binding protein CbpA